MLHTEEFRRCLILLDVPGIRRLWAHVAPGLPQPATDQDALHSMHLARVAMKTLPAALKDYSEAWLRERGTGRVAHAVGISVKSISGREDRAADVREAMSDAVLLAIKDGVDLAAEPGEVKRRMMSARARA